MISGVVGMDAPDLKIMPQPTFREALRFWVKLGFISFWRTRRTDRHLAS